MGLHALIQVGYGLGLVDFGEYGFLPSDFIRIDTRRKRAISREQAVMRQRVREKLPLEAWARV
jgi:hypothetical protein